MPQFKPRTHRAKSRLDAISAGYAWAWMVADEARQGISWPPHIFVPTKEFATVAGRTLSEHADAESRRWLIDQGEEYWGQMIAAMITFAAWRMTQGIYRFDPAVYPVLIDTADAGSLPVDVLAQLPEWCIYIEAPGLKMSDDTPAHGAWVRHDLSSQGQPMLAITLDVDTADAGLPPTQHLILDGGSIADAIEAARVAWAEGGGSELPDGASVDKVLPWAVPIINLLLYICSQSADIAGRRGQPGNPTPVRTRRDGWRLFPADGLRTWDVGVRMGAALRAAYQSAETGQGGEYAGPRGHIRRAHWHGFRSGPRKRDDGTEIPAHLRKFDLRWLPPIPVNLGDVSELPATIRRV